MGFQKSWSPKVLTTTNAYSKTTVSAINAFSSSRRPSSLRLTSGLYISKRYHHLRFLCLLTYLWPSLQFYKVIILLCYSLCVRRKLYPVSSANVCSAMSVTWRVIWRVSTTVRFIQYRKNLLQKQNKNNIFFVIFYFSSALFLEKFGCIFFLLFCRKMGFAVRVPGGWLSLPLVTLWRRTRSFWGGWPDFSLIFFLIMK